MLCTGGGARLRGAWACSPPREGQQRGAHLLSPSPRSPRRRSSRSPRAGPACRTGPGRSGRSWISSGWKAAASQSEPGPDPPRCGQRGRVRRLHGTPPPPPHTHTRDPWSPRSHAPPLPPERPGGEGAPSTHTPRAHPTAGLPCSRAPCAPRGARGTPPPPPSSQERRESFVWVLRGRQDAGSTGSDLTRALRGERGTWPWRR